MSQRSLHDSRAHTSIRLDLLKGQPNLWHHVFRAASWVTTAC